LLRAATQRHCAPRIGAQRTCARTLLVLLGPLFCVLAGSSDAADGHAKSVLVRSGGVGHSISIDLMESTLQAHVPWPVKSSDDIPMSMQGVRAPGALAVLCRFGNVEQEQRS
jgi:hypothetical protein